jgi:hypothetical protein
MSRFRSQLLGPRCAATYALAGLLPLKLVTHLRLATETITMARQLNPRTTAIKRCELFPSEPFPSSTGHPLHIESHSKNLSDP